MQYKLERFEKFWPDINKWVVSYTVPSLGYIMQNSFHKNKDKADTEALAAIKKSIRFQEEIARAGETSEVTMTV